MSIEYTAPPQSRNEAILADTINDVEYTDPPQSRIEDLLIDLNGKVIGKQDALTEEQLAAVNSGINGEKVEQLETLNKASSTSYNSADCNISLFLYPDNGAVDNSTYYTTSDSKMHFRMRWVKNQLLYTDITDGTQKNKFRYERYGVILTSNVDKSKALTLTIPQVSGETIVASSSKPDTETTPNTDTGTYMANKSNVSVGDVWYVRPYVVMTDLEYNHQFTTYGSVYKVTAGVPCTIECATLSCTELTTELNALKAQLANLTQGG